MGECPVDPMRMRIDSIMKLDQKSKRQRAKDLWIKATITLDEITNAKPELDMIHIVKTVAASFTVLRKELFNGP